MFGLGAACGLLILSAPASVRFQRHLLGSRLWHSGNEAKLIGLAQNQPLDGALLEKRLAILEAQLPNGEWEHALAAAGITPEVFVARLQEHQRELSWIEEAIRGRIRVTPQDRRDYYQANRSRFVFPMRLRARHIFFAAPDGSLPGLVEQKQRAAASVLERLARGESFETIAIESEDEATKTLDGDLNFFAQNRMLPEIWNGLAGAKAGGRAVLVRSHLGFHVIQLTDERPSREMGFEEGAGAIAGAVENGRRLSAVKALREKLVR
jgi:parvulin-like peptidyl-prolyl cis-trans isomerase-like protein